MNRQQRRAAERAGARTPVARVFHDVDEQVRRRRHALADHAKRIRAAVPYPGESIEDSIVALEAMVEELEAPHQVVFGDLALVELRGAIVDLQRRRRLS